MDRKQCHGYGASRRFFCLEKNDDLGEEPIQTTPPDVSKTEKALSVKSIPLADNAEENPGKGCFGTNDCQLNGHVLMSKSVLKPHLSGKFFKAPSSVNYRRLMAIMGDDFGA